MSHARAGQRIDPGWLKCGSRVGRYPGMSTRLDRPRARKRSVVESYDALDLGLRAVLPFVGGLERRAHKALFRACDCEAELYDGSIIVHVCVAHDAACSAMLAAQFDDAAESGGLAR